MALTMRKRNLLLRTPRPFRARKGERFVPKASAFPHPGMGLRALGRRGAVPQLEAEAEAVAE